LSFRQQEQEQLFTHKNVTSMTNNKYIILC